jgi:hypothetical protein
MMAARRIPLWAGVPLVLVVAFYAIRGMAFTARMDARPAADTFDAFARMHGEPEYLALNTIHGRRYIVWTPLTTGWAVLLRLGSGAPIYVFDDMGTLVGWSPTTGDGEFRRFSAYGPERQITLQGALELIESTHRDMSRSPEK